VRVQRFERNDGSAQWYGALGAERLLATQLRARDVESERDLAVIELDARGRIEPQMRLSSARRPTAAAAGL